MRALPPPELAAAALAALPIFPLPDCVLLPGGVLPLHIFEPRYRRMTADALAGHRLIAMARLRPDQPVDGHERPAVDQVVGVGGVVGVERLADGRYHILLLGLGRAAIEHEHAPGPSYRQVAARLAHDTAVDPGALAARHSQLLLLCDQLATQLSEGGDELRELARDAGPGGACADRLASALIADVDERQALLETCDPLARLDVVAAHVAALVARMDPTPRQRN